MLSRISNLLFILCIAFGTYLSGDGARKPAHISHSVWDHVAPFMIPDNHPVKLKLDEIFAKGRPIASPKELARAGFKDPIPRKFTRVIVTSHSKLPGYLIKAYADSQHYHRNKPEWHIWILRILGAELVQKEIDENGWHDWFSTPKKWIYAIPHPERYYHDRNPRKDFLLVVEDMHLVKEHQNEHLWASKEVTKERLIAFFNIVTRLGLWDCAKTANAPFTQSGKIAFIDTESFARWPVFYEKLTKNLSTHSKEIWNGLAGNAHTVHRSQRARELRHRYP